mgnify:CR=1 FL=1
MNRSDNWDVSLAATIGGFLGATYTLVMCAISSLLSVPSMSIVMFVVILGATLGGGTLSGIAVLLNRVRGHGTIDFKRSA